MNGVALVILWYCLATHRRVGAAPWLWVTLFNRHDAAIRPPKLAPCFCFMDYLSELPRQAGRRSLHHLKPAQGANTGKWKCSCINTATLLLPRRIHNQRFHFVESEAAGSRKSSSAGHKPPSEVFSKTLVHLMSSLQTPLTSLRWYVASYCTLTQMANYAPRQGLISIKEWRLLPSSK